MVQKIYTETEMIMRWDLEALQVNYGMECVLFTVKLVLEIGNYKLTTDSVMELLYNINTLANHYRVGQANCIH